jgi:hypothetical protein
LIASGSIKLRRPMALLIATKLVWLLKVLNSSMALTMKKLLVPLLNLLLSVWFCQLLFHVVGIFDS